MNFWRDTRFCSQQSLGSFGIQASGLQDHRIMHRAAELGLSKVGACKMCSCESSSLASHSELFQVELIHWSAPKFSANTRYYNPVEDSE